MNLGKFVFAQVMEHLPLHGFHRCVVRYSGEHKVKRFSCLDQYLCMAFAQLTYRESLRDIEACLGVQSSKLYHLGFRSPVARNTLANANATRDWRIYCDFAQSLIGTARRLYADEAFGLDLKDTTRSMPPRSICVSQSFPGRRSARPKRRSSCTRSWICGAISRPSSTVCAGRSSCSSSGSSSICGSRRSSARPRMPSRRRSGSQSRSTCWSPSSRSGSSSPPASMKSYRS